LSPIYDANGQPYNCSSNYAVPCKKGFQISSISINKDNGLKHFIIEVPGKYTKQNGSQNDFYDFTENDFITIGYYAGSPTFAMDNEWDNMFLVTAELNKYYLDDNKYFEVPVPTNFSVVFDDQNYTVNISWDNMSDDNKFVYDVCYSQDKNRVFSTYCIYNSDNRYHLNEATNKYELTLYDDEFPVYYSTYYISIKARDIQTKVESLDNPVFSVSILQQPKVIDFFIDNIN